MNQKNISRRQRRFRERLQDQVSEVSQFLGDAFLNFFTTASDPEGREVTEKMAQIDCQWRLFCQEKKLQSAAYPHMRQYMESIVNNYLKMKNHNQEKANEVKV